MKSFLGRLFGGDGPSPSYEESRKLARDPDQSVRRRLARRTDVRPEVLYYLAEDESADVRREIAINETTPAHANVLLARDSDGDVRCDLAQKIARLTPELGDDERDRIRELTLEALDILVQDHLARVREALAESLKDVANVPHDVITRLARDTELAVAAPVLEFSPVLTDEDLLEIIANPAVQGAIAAISRRDGVSEGVSDAIAASDDEDAVAALLGNASAQIREETLDLLVEGSRRVTRWQMPMVMRPLLPAGAVRKLAGFVTDAVLGALMRRDDLDAQTADLVGKAVRERMDEGGRPEAADGDAAGKRDGDKTADEVRALYAAGKLDQDAIDNELISGNRAFVTESLALLSGLPPGVVARIISARSAKAITALAWKAGLSMRFAIKLQTRFANVPRREVLHAKNGVDYPMSEEDMEWQINFFSG